MKYFSSILLIFNTPILSGKLLHFGQILSKSAPMKTDAQLQQIEELEARLEALSLECESAKSAQLRALADLQNVQRRESEHKKNWVNSGIAEFVKPLLPRFLELQLGAEHSGDADMKKAVTHFFNELKKMGIEPINPKKGELMNPNLHEVLMAEEGTPGTVVRVLEIGWRFGDTILTPAKVSAAQNS